MAQDKTFPKKTVRFGSELPYVVYFTDTETGQSLAAATATLKIYDSSGAQQLAATSMTVSGTTRLKATYTITTGSGKNITAAGTYRVRIILTFGSYIDPWQGELQVLADPS